MASKAESLQTERLFFEGISDNDTEDIVRWRSDPDVYKYFKSPHMITVDEHLNWYKNTYLYNEDRIDWICIEKKSAKKIGVFGLIREREYAEVNYLLDSDARHKGYATEAISELVNYAKETWTVRRVIAEIHKDNEPSVSVVKKLGFSLQETEGDFVIYGIEV